MWIPGGCSDFSGRGSQRAVLARGSLASEGLATSTSSSVGGQPSTSDGRWRLEGLAERLRACEKHRRAAQGKGSAAAQGVDSMGGAGDLGIATGVGVCRAPWVR
jgi:hypothetical protein